MASWQLFIRHAHRPTFDRDLDNGLSEKGKEQGRALVQFLRKKGYLDKITGLYSSPKLRCIETAEFVAESTGLTVQVDLQLDEQGRHESREDFDLRVTNFAQRVLKMNQVCFFSHGDFLPFLARIYGEQAVQIKKGDLFSLKNGKICQINPIHSSGN